MELTIQAHQSLSIGKRLDCRSERIEETEASAFDLAHVKLGSTLRDPIFAHEYVPVSNTQERKFKSFVQVMTQKT